MAEIDRWERPSEEARELIARVAGGLLEDPAALFGLVDRSVLGAAPERLTGDPALVEAAAAANHANLMRWIAANAAAPGERVRVELPPEVLDLARDIVRRGLDDTSLNSYRVGQNAAFAFLIDWVFDASRDTELIHEVLTVLSRSVFSFVDDTLAAIQEQLDAERERLTRGTHAERFQAVNLILEGAPISVERAEARLGYDLGAVHRAAVVWTAKDAPSGAAERAAAAVARALGSPRPLTVVATASTIWVWMTDSGTVDEDRLRRDIELPDGVSVAVGSPAPGMAGFRRSHLDALETQRLMQRSAAAWTFATYAEIEALALCTADEQRALEFASRRLGDLASADPVLAETLRAYIGEQFNTSATARVTYAHRNTVVNRLERARALLPGPLEGNAVEIGLALEIQRVFATAAAARPAP